MVKGIPQRRAFDCAIATVAMAANVEYDRVYRLAAGWWGTLRNGLNQDAQAALLIELTQKGWSIVTPNKPKLLKELAFDAGEPTPMLVSVYWNPTHKEPSAHSIFTDGGKFYDPAWRMWFYHRDFRRIPKFGNRRVRGIIVETDALS